MARSIILLLDSFGIGYAHDAEKFGDSGADTLGIFVSGWLQTAKVRMEVQVFTSA